MHSATTKTQIASSSMLTQTTLDENFLKSIIEIAKSSKTNLNEVLVSGNVQRRDNLNGKWH